MWTSVFDIFKIGLGPSSSHVVGPMVAARRFTRRLSRAEALAITQRITITLYGSLSLTCRGHGTDGALLLGLSGADPATVDPDDAAALVKAVRLQKRLTLAGQSSIGFDEERDLILETRRRLPRHSNAMTFAAYDGSATLIMERTYYSIGGGFVASDQDFDAPRSEPTFPYPFDSAAGMILQGDNCGLSISEMARANELCLRPSAEIDGNIDALIATMMDCIDRGMAGTGTLPGGLGLTRRAAALHQRLQQRRRSNQPGPHEALDWVSLYAIAINEENAAGGRVVTAPTNGAAGVVPAVLRFYRDFCAADAAGEQRYILTAGAIGGLFKRNASISGAEVGCQGEVGVACSMAAAGLTAALEGSNRQIENAAEIGMEHHLGMTCDPISGLVQIPCIERNAMGAVKAVTASSLAMNGDGSHHVSLDTVIRTMMATGRDMSEKYKETSLGGLAVNVPTC